MATEYDKGKRDGRLIPGSARPAIRPSAVSGTVDRASSPAQGNSAMLIHPLAAVAWEFHDLVRDQKTKAKVRDRCGSFLDSRKVDPARPALLDIVRQAEIFPPLDKRTVLTLDEKYALLVAIHDEVCRSEEKLGAQEMPQEMPQGMPQMGRGPAMPIYGAGGRPFRQPELGPESSPDVAATRRRRWRNLSRRPGWRPSGPSVNAGRSGLAPPTAMPRPPSAGLKATRRSLPPPSESTVADELVKPQPEPQGDEPMRLPMSPATANLRIFPSTPPATTRPCRCPLVCECRAPARRHPHRKRRPREAGHAGAQACFGQVR